MKKKEAQEAYMQGKKIRHKDWHDDFYEYRGSMGECLDHCDEKLNFPLCFMSDDKNDGWEEYYEIPEGFTRWEGGECPVDGEVKVDVIFQVGRSSRVLKAKSWEWNVEGDARIIAYKVIREEITGETVGTKELEYWSEYWDKWREMDGCGVPLKTNYLFDSRGRYKEVMRVRYKDEPDTEVTIKREEPKTVEKRYEFEWDTNLPFPDWRILRGDMCYIPSDCIYLKGFKHFIYGERLSVVDYEVTNGELELPTAVVFEEGGE